MNKYVIGVNASFHDSAVCVFNIDSKEPILILSEDRHSGIPRHFGFPFAALEQAIDTCKNGEILAVGHSRNKQAFVEPPLDYFSDFLDQASDAEIRNKLPVLFQTLDKSFNISKKIGDMIKKLDSIIESQPERSLLRKRIAYLVRCYINELRVEGLLHKIIPNVPLFSLNHHECHAATYFASSFSDATVITWDGRGEFDSTVLWHATGDKLKRLVTLSHPLSLGTFYANISEYVGFNRVTGPGKMMGLAGYGDDRFVQLFEEILQPSDTEFNFSYNPEYLSIALRDDLRFTPLLMELIGPPLQAGSTIEPRHQAIAKAAQKQLEKVCAKLVKNGISITGSSNLVLSGGVSLNCVMNEQLRACCGVEPFMLPACGDDGTAIGAGLILRMKYSSGHVSRGWFDFYGTSNEPAATKRELEKLGLQYRLVSPSELAGIIVENQTVGFISGRYEFGPRSLGCRSILANPGPYENWPLINQKIKFREDFRPFAPMMLRAEAERLWGHHSRPTTSPYMLLAPQTNIIMQKSLRAVVHMDTTSRIQTLDKDSNPYLYSVLQEMKRLTGFGVLLNTSLNMSGESIISNHLDLIMFLSISGIDAAYLDGLLVEKKANVQAFTRLASIVGSRKDYLARRPDLYRQFLQTRGYHHQPLDLSQLYLAAFGEKERIPVG